MWYSNPGKDIYFSTYPPPTLIHLSHRFKRASNIEVFWLCLSHFRTWSGITCDFQTSLTGFLDTVMNRFTRQTLPILNRKHFFMDILCTESVWVHKTHNRTSVFGNTLLKHVHHFDCWNQLLNMRMRVCYLDCHEAGLCCYLVIHIEYLLHPLQLFYFHLWRIYCISLVQTDT
jgi:hypothetical protein